MLFPVLVQYRFLKKYDVLQQLLCALATAVMFCYLS